MSSEFGDSFFYSELRINSSELFNLLKSTKPNKLQLASLRFTLFPAIFSRVESEPFPLLLDRLVSAFHLFREPERSEELYAPIDGIEQKKYEG